MNEPETADARARTAPVLGLLVPAETRQPVRVVLVPTSSVAFSDTIGDDLLVGIDARDGDCDIPAGVLVAACQAEQRVTVDVDPDVGVYVP